MLRAWRDKRASQTQSNLMLGSLPKELSCPCSGKAFLCGHNKTIQPTSHSLYQLHQIWMLLMPVSHYQTFCNTDDPNKNLLTEVWGVHAGSGEQLDPHRTYQPGSGRKEVCTCGPVVPLHTTPCLMNRYREG